MDDYYGTMSKSTFCLSFYGYGWGIRIGQVIFETCIPVTIQDSVFQPFESESSSSRWYSTWLTCLGFTCDIGSGLGKDGELHESNILMKRRLFPHPSPSSPPQISFLMTSSQSASAGETYPGWPRY